ncbi:hypothetical protein C8T65DRAFT_659249 [Cerioporus squamosus]|nr:hypothetical protein C8T65DRAFT_659249 [Cerioporus squamosus]
MKLSLLRAPVMYSRAARFPSALRVRMLSPLKIPARQTSPPHTTTTRRWAPASLLWTSSSIRCRLRESPALY